jgi:hypothetical protein
LFSIARGYEEAQQFQEAERVYRCLVKLKGPNERAAAIRLDFIHDTKAALSQETLEAFTQLSVQKYSPMTKSGIKQAATEEIARGIYTGC